jgi:ketosteroid isomerase-like protein
MSANLDVVRAGIAAFNSGDVEAVIRITEPHIEFIPMRAPVQGAYRGHDGIREFFADNAQNFDVFHLHCEELHESGDQVVQIGTVRVRGKGSGVDVTVPSATLMTIRDGKVVRFEELREREKALAAAGLDA